MANIAKKIKNEEIARLEGMNRRLGDLSKYGRNLNLQALSGDIAPVFNREAEVESIMKLLLRRTKPNILLTGPAGCGKTAIAEALASHIANQRLEWIAEQDKADKAYNRALKKCEVDEETGELLNPPAEPVIAKPPLCDAIVYELSMNSVVSGAKYRGEFEEKLEKILALCKADRNVILFIDEIHQINVIGQAEGASNMGQILKPAMARAEVRIIGATTTEESAILKKDKALARRFSELEVRPLVGETAVTTAESILADYEQYHGVKVRGITAKNILEMVNFHIGGVFPNNFIDAIDEAMSGAKYEGETVITMEEIKATIGRMSGHIIL
jgi:ATP-dependent Clp protease ATP-binding subunit ClpA